MFPGGPPGRGVGHAKSAKEKAGEDVLCSPTERKTIIEGGSVVEGIRNRPAWEAPDERETLSYWFPPGIHEADAETYRSQWLR